MRLNIFFLMISFSPLFSYAANFEITASNQGYGFYGNYIVSSTDGKAYPNEVKALVYNDVSDILIIKSTNPNIVDRALTSVHEVELNACSKALIGESAHGLSFSKYVAFVRVGYRVLKVEENGDVKDHYGDDNFYYSIGEFLSDKQVCSSQL